MTDTISILGMIMVKFALLIPLIILPLLPAYSLYEIVISSTSITEIGTAIILCLCFTGYSLFGIVECFRKPKHLGDKE